MLPRSARRPSQTGLRVIIQQTTKLRAFVEEAIATRLNFIGSCYSGLGRCCPRAEHHREELAWGFQCRSASSEFEWKAAKTTDDLSTDAGPRILDRCALSIIGKNVKDQLKDCLELRNGCSHPNSEIGANKVELKCYFLRLQEISITSFPKVMRKMVRRERSRIAQTLGNASRFPSSRATGVSLEHIPSKRAPRMETTRSGVSTRLLISPEMGTSSPFSLLVFFYFGNRGDKHLGVRVHGG